MHFNRTQFAAKTHVRLFALAILILVFLLSSCTIGDIDLGAWTICFRHSTSGQPHLLALPIQIHQALTMDSILYDSISIYKVCSSIRFDSTIVLTGFTFNYWETNGQSETNEIRQAIVIQ